MTLSLKALSFGYGSGTVLKNLTFDVEAGEFYCLAGVSGCGKSTLLRLIAGLESPHTGSITLEGKLLADERHSTPPERRGIGLVFQHFSLFPHLTVLQNVLFGMRQASELHAKLLLTTVHYEGDPHAYPHHLSGGQQQRIALARALATEPRLLLLDEPFANLDYGLRKTLREETRQLLKSKGVTTVMVTHDPKEAMQMADRILLLSPAGEIHQHGAPQTLYQRPVDAEAALFFGRANILKGTIENGVFRSAVGSVTLPARCREGEAQMMLRPEAIRLCAEPTALYGLITRRTYSGSHQMLDVTLEDGTLLLIDDYQLLSVNEGDRVHLAPDLSRTHCFAL